jgi:hypothetical protein
MIQILCFAFRYLIHCCEFLVVLTLTSVRFITLLQIPLCQMVKVGEQEELSRLKIAECKENLKRIREEKVRLTLLPWI